LSEPGDKGTMLGDRAKQMEFTIGRGRPRIVTSPQRTREYKQTSLFGLGQADVQQTITGFQKSREAAPVFIPSLSEQLRFDPVTPFP
jgi:hypothetical protein